MAEIKTECQQQKRRKKVDCLRQKLTPKRSCIIYADTFIYLYFSQIFPGKSFKDKTKNDIVKNPKSRTPTC